MKKNTAAVYLPLGLKRFSLERPRVEEVEVLYLASSRTVVRFIPRTFVLLFFLLFFVFWFFYFVLECVVRHRAALLGLILINFCGTLINCLSVQGSGEGGSERRLGTFAPKTHRPCSMAHVNSTESEEDSSESWGLCSWHVYRGQYAVWRNVTSTHSPSVILTFLSSSSSLCLPPSLNLIFQQILQKTIGLVCKYVV